MSDDLWDWGEAGDPVEEKERKEAEKQDRDTAYTRYIARQKEVEQKRKDKASRRTAAVLDAANADQSSTHIWFGFVDGNIRNKTKEITGKSLDATYYVRLNKAGNYIGNIMYEALKGHIQGITLVRSYEKAAAIRLTKAEAMKAKLAETGAQVILEDPLGESWYQINATVAAIEAKQDISFHQEGLKRLVAVMTELMRKRSEQSQ